MVLVMPNIVVFSDLHLHNWQYGATIINGVNSRLQQQVEVVESIVSYCLERDIREVIFCGDLYHTSTITAEVSQAAYKAFKGFKKNNINLYMLVGNHDQSNRLGSIHALSWFKEIGQLIHNNAIATIAGLNSHFLAYTNDEEVLKSHLSGIKERSLCFFHQGVGGVEVNSKGFTLNEILNPTMLPSSCILGFSGHYHSFKQVSDNLIIPGSTMQLNFGDEGETRGWLDIEIDKDQITNITLIESNASKFITLAEDKIEESELQGHFIRIMSNGKFSPDEISDTILHKYKAASVEIKPIYKEYSLTKTEVATVASLNDVVYSFANSKERAGVISLHDKDIGEQLLKEIYEIPSV